MTENPYEPPRYEEVAPRELRPIDWHRTCLLGVSLVMSAVAAVAVYVFGVAVLHATGVESTFGGGFAIVILAPIVPAYLLVRSIANYLSTPLWWDTTAIAMSALLAFFMLVALIG